MQWLFAAGGLLVMIPAFLVAMGFRGREQIVGIDLGTTFSVVALQSRDNAGTSIVTVLPDRFSGKPLVPSVVSYYANGSTVVGDLAVLRRAEHPDSTIYNAKRFIGRKFSEVTADATGQHYKVAVGVNESAGFEIPHQSGDASFWVSPIDVGAEVVRHLKLSVTAYLGYEIHRAVICVPAKFGEAESRATQAAFEKAGIKVMRVLEEPTAAAVAYGLHKKPGTRYTLVYDIGGGTLDTSLLYMNGKSVSVLGVAGDDRLGGSDFDLRMQQLLRSKVEAAAVLEPAPGGQIERCDSNGLHIAGERAKIRLSTEDAVDVRCLDDDGHVRVIQVTRTEFEDASADLFARAMAPVKKVLEDQMMGADNVHDIVLVGGASRMPKLRSLLQEFFGADRKLHTEIDPDVTVAYGAANIVD